MKRFASALPFRNFTRFDFRGDDRAAEEEERRRVFFDRFLAEGEPLRLRRRGPPPSEFLDIPGQPPIQLESAMFHFFPGATAGARCNANSAASSGSIPLSSSEVSRPKPT